MELGTMQRRRTSCQIALFSISRPLELASNIEDKVFWDLTEDGKYSNKSTWSLITQRKPTEHNIAQDTLCNCCTLPKRESMQHVFLRGEAAQYVWNSGSTLEGHWESEFTTGGIKNQIVPSTS